MAEQKMEYRKVQGLIGETSFGVILPKNYATSLGIRKGDFVKMCLENGKIIIKKVDNV